MKKMYLVLLLVFIIVLGACGKNEDSKNSNGKVTLNIMTWNNNPEGSKKEREVFDKFEEAHPNIKVEVIGVAYDKYNDKLMTMSAGGDQPDLMWIQPNSFGALVEKNLLLDLSDYVKELDKNEFLPNILEMGQVDGVQYGMLRDSSTTQIGYNKDMFDAAGVAYPSDNWTMEDFLETAKKLTIKDGDRVTQYGMENFYTLSLLTAYDTFIVNPSNNKLTLNDKASQEAIQFGSDLINVYNVQPTAAQSQGLSNMFLSGQAAMRMTGPWDWIEYEKNVDFKWDIVPLPAGSDKGNLSAAAYLPISIGKNTKHKDEAWELLKYLTYGEGQDIQAEILAAIPVVKRAQESIKDLAGAPENVQCLIDQLSNGSIIQNTSYLPEYKEIETEALSGIESINLKGGDVKNSLKEIAERIKNEFSLK